MAEPGSHTLASTRVTRWYC